jgi:methylenetetrahydrofolate dehydrogenase (NADP+)/methenyltetrahydrofolate cyclohydrolase
VTPSFKSLLAKPVAEAIRASVAARAAKFAAAHGRKPKLSVVIVGDDPGSLIYTNNKRETALKLGMESEIVKFPATATALEVRAAVARLNEDPSVDGILVQRPLPPTFKEEEVLYWVSPEKDVDAFHPENLGRLTLGLPCFRPCTPAGVMEILQHYEIDPAGKTACVIGRSSIVGKPMAALLLNANATVIMAHSRTRNLKELTLQAEILVVAVGRAKMIDASYVRPGAVVIDVGINRDAQGKVVDDVDSVAGSVLSGGAGQLHPWFQLVLRVAVAAVLPVRLLG